MQKMLEKYYEGGKHRKPLMLVEDIETLTNLDWRKMRQNGIGGSDAGAIMNRSEPTFKTAFDVARSKLEELDEELASPSDQFRLNFGHALEPIILEWYQRTQNAHVFTDRGMYYNPEHPFMLADCDGFAVTSEGELIGLEIKTTSVHKMKCWSSGEYGKGGEIGFPIYYTQVQHYMAVMDIDRFDIVVCFNNCANDIKIVTVHRDKDYQKALIETEEYFWNNLDDIASQMPDFISALNAKETVEKLRTLGVKIDDQSASEKCAEYLEKKAKMDELKEQMDLLEKSMEADKILILASIKDNEPTYFSGKYKVVNKVSTYERYDTKELKKHPELDIYKKKGEMKKFNIWEL